MSDRRDPGEFPPREPRDDKKGKNEPPRYGRATKTMAFWVVVILLFLIVFNLVYNDTPPEQPIDYTEFLEQVDGGNIRKLEFVEKDIHGELVAPAVTVVGDRSQSYTNFFLTVPDQEEGLVERVLTANPDARIKATKQGVNWTQVIFAWLPILLILGIWIFIMRQMQTGGNRAFTFGKSKARLLTGGDRPKVTFDDVAGANEAKQELQEIIEFLREPAKFQKLGGKIPKGALLLGSPGTGKTLLAKAVAGEAGVPFFSMSGSDFVEMFVGVGASRVRDLFEQGRKNAPCIIFIDEIDAVGRHRGAGLGGGHDEREQTLNQLLVEMDGFDSSDGVILIAATNRPDVLDPALLRPGRFDRQVVVDLPDVRGRLGILRVHSRPIPLDESVDLEKIARGTPGFSGADLANVMNEAALLAARRNRDKVLMIDLLDAKDKVAVGAERKSVILSEKDKEVIAYHEAGHALVGLKTEHADPVEKVTIVPRGRALGVTYFLPKTERHNLSKSYCQARIATAMGGRVAEEIVFNEITNGAKGDIDSATNMARAMVCEWGMSERLGPIALGRGDDQVFLGREIVENRHVSEETAEAIDAEVRAIVEGARKSAHDILTNHRDVLDSIAMALLERETIDADDLALLLEGSPLPVRAPREDTSGETSEAVAPSVGGQSSASPSAGTGGQSSGGSSSGGQSSGAPNPGGPTSGDSASPGSSSPSGDANP